MRPTAALLALVLLLSAHGAAAWSDPPGSLAAVTLDDGTTLTGLVTPSADGLLVESHRLGSQRIPTARVRHVRILPPPSVRAPGAAGQASLAAPQAGIPAPALPPAVPQPVPLVRPATLPPSTASSPSTERIATAAAVERSVTAAAWCDQAASAPAPCASPCAPPVKSPWHFRAAFAFGLGQGNSDFFDLRLDGEVERDATPWGGRLAVTYVYGSKEDEDTANNWRVLGRVERKIGPRAYAFGQTLYERDPLADLQYRVTATVGLGWTVVDTTKNTFKAEAGLGATWEKRDGYEETIDPSGWIGLDWEHRFDECRKLRTALSFRPNFGEFDLSASTLEVRYTTPCFKLLNLEVALRLEDVIDPPGDTEPLDLLFTVGLKLEV